LEEELIDESNINADDENGSTGAIFNAAVRYMTTQSHLGNEEDP
jgi:hypothetical protein